MMANPQIIHIFKRLALGIPTLLFITSIVFLLSKAMPGSSGEYLWENEGSIGLHANDETRENIYQAYLQRTGQDRPLFYFTLSSWAEPDTLNKAFLEKHRRFLKQLCLTYGNWQYVNAYYQALLQFRESVHVLPEREDIGLVTDQLFDAVAEAQIQKVWHNLSILLPNHDEGGVAELGLMVQKRFEELVQNKQPYRKLLPVVYWNGMDNQYHAWLTGLLQGDMGSSLKGQRPVSTVIGEAIGITLVMSVAALCMGWVIALGLGILVNLPACQKIGRPIMTGLYVLDTVPLFLLSFLFLIIFSAVGYQGMLPTFQLEDYSNAGGSFSRIGALLNQIALPVICMMLSVLPYITAQVDRAVKEELKREHVKTAYAKGLTDFVVLTKHVLKNAWIPLITLFTNNLPALISGAVVVEVIFAVPGMGRLLVHAVSGRDYPVILGIVIMVAAVKIVANILADILYAFADPRIKIGR